VKQKIDSIFAAYDRPDTPGASIVVVRGGVVAFDAAYGLADLEARVRTTPRTDYRLASLTKQFTATAIMLLIQDGKLGLDQPAAAVLPDLPSSARSVTVRQLLTHTSGLWAYEDFVPDSQSVQVTDRDVLSLIGRADSTYFTPGTQYRYSNSGYVLLGLIVEAVSHRPFAEFLRERIFAPLHMDSTVAFRAGVSSVPNRAFGYSRTATGFHRTDQSPTSATLGDGGIYTSTHDLVAWNRALDEHMLINADMQQLAWTPNRLSNGTATSYGFGWNIDQRRRGRHIWHTGETRGFTNAIVKYPDQGVTVIVLTNRSGGDPLSLAEAVAALPAFGGAGAERD
jgi:CubicO group peptidase (beta-lactamase class C family)